MNLVFYLLTFIFSPGDHYNVVDVEVSKIENSGIAVTRCDYYEYLKCYCLTMDDKMFPYGVQGVYLHPINDTDIITFIVPPGNFFDFSRKLNKLEVQHGAGYEYVIKYDIFRLLNLAKRPCNSEISWKEDDCKMEKVNKIGSLIYFQIVS